MTIFGSTARSRYTELPVTPSLVRPLDRAATRATLPRVKPQAMVIPASLRQAHATYFESPRTQAGYENPWKRDMVPGFRDVLRWKTGSNPHRPSGYRARPVEIPATPLADFETLRAAPTRIFWIGHASFLVEMDGVRVVIDPVFGRAGGLVKRVTQAAASPDELRGIDAVVVTHGHHDHFDRASLRALALANEGKARFLVPSGLARVLPRECVRRTELAWWQYVQMGGVRIHLVPAQHWHRRSAFDLNASLWGGCAITGTHCVYHSGDTGYFDGFRAIGDVFGGFDVACLPLGAYEPRWFMGPQHMSPEESLTALDALRARHLLGMHWGAFDLSDEPVDAGPELLMRTASERGTLVERLHVLRPGGSLALTDAQPPSPVQVLHRYPLA